MSYQVLARKWRPQTFADVVGQEHVLTALANGLSLGRIHHAYLFSGTRGVGKTSIARLLAKGLNCETGITATPCGVCDNCREIEQGRLSISLRLTPHRVPKSKTPATCWITSSTRLRAVALKSI
ncbi:putative DNA polymerase III subunit tau [Salmonella enterica subsp. enterica serovar Newport str. VA_R100512572]|nr:putative DNA polymerase III subunit tau [Salmonella enterica subsp. enterica serovar Newport str. VA_R100512572]